MKIFSELISEILFDPSESARIEFSVLKVLEHENISVSRVYAFENSGNNTFSFPFLLLEFIHGSQLHVTLKNLQKQNLRKEFMELIKKIVTYDIKLHNLDFSKFSHVFPKINQSNPFYYLSHDLDIWKTIIDTKLPGEIVDPLLLWIQRRIENIPIQKYSLINRDFGIGNFIVTDLNKLVMVDWRISYITDFRLSLGFFLVQLDFEAFPFLNSRNYLALYEKESSLKVKNVVFFKILALLKDLMIKTIILKSKEFIAEEEKININKTLTFLKKSTDINFNPITEYLGI